MQYSKGLTLKGEQIIILKSRQHWGGNISVDFFLFVLFYNTNGMNILKFNAFFKNHKAKIIIGLILDSEERLVNFVRRRECCVGLSILLVFALCSLIKRRE